MRIGMVVLFLCFSLPSISAKADAQRGYELLTRKPFQNIQMHPLLFANLWRVWEPEHRERARKASRAERRRMTMERYGFFYPPEGGTMPMGYTRTSSGSWAVNCLSCHGGAILGRPMPGLGNTYVDLQTYVEDITKALGSEQLARLEKIIGKQNVEKILKAIGVEDFVDIYNHSAGTTRAFEFAMKGLAGRDENLERLDHTVPMGNFVGSDLSPPAYWHVKKKTRLYSDGFAPVTARALMQFVAASRKSGSEIRSWEGDFAQILDWIKSVEPPKYPGRIDPVKAEAGRRAFNRECASCHGTYGPGGSYTTRVVPLDVVRTDPLRLVGMTPEFRQYFKNSWFGDDRRDEIVVSPRGYVAPPLDGVWASAPYFHNGSVPTLEHVLYPQKRPTVWKVRDRNTYDLERVGLLVDEFSSVPPSARANFEKRRHFDTRLDGKHNGGHPQSNRLTDVEKPLVLEYLKTL